LDDWLALKKTAEDLSIVFLVSGRKGRVIQEVMLIEKVQLLLGVAGDVLDLRDRDIVRILPLQSVRVQVRYRFQGPQGHVEGLVRLDDEGCLGLGSLPCCFRGHGVEEVSMPLDSGKGICVDLALGAHDVWLLDAGVVIY